MSAMSAAPVATVLQRRATAPFPPAMRSAMIPDPTTAARSRPLPTPSATTVRASPDIPGSLVSAIFVDAIIWGDPPEALDVATSTYAGPSRPEGGYQPTQRMPSGVQLTT